MACAVRILVIVAFLILLPSCEMRKYFQSFAGPYWVLLLKFYQCPNQEIQDPLFNCSAKLLNYPKSYLEPQRMNFWTRIQQDWTDALSLSFELDVWANNQWKENAFAKMNFPKSCSTFRSYVQDFSHKLYGIDVSSKSPCIIPAGVYAMNNTAVNWTFPPFPQFVYGHYRGKLTFNRDKISVWCTRTEVKILPLPV